MLGTKEVYMPVQKPIGSFGGSVEAIDKAIKDNESKESKAPVADEVEEATKLPTVIHTMRGPLAYSKFKELFKEVWAQVADKQYLLSGRVRLETELAGFKVVFRSLLRKEEQALAVWEPAPSAYAENGALLNPDGHGGRVEQQIAHGLRRLLLQLERVDSVVIELPPLTAGDRDKWLDDPKVVSKLEWLGNMDTMFITALMEMLNDFGSARYYALRENLLNPSKPLSPTTA
jgi:hypothetical protein